MTFAEALLYSVVGIAVVFFALVLLMIICKILLAVGGEKKPEAAKAEAPAAPAPEPVREPAPGSAGEVKLYDTDPRDAAMIMAIIAEELKTPLNELRFKSIREVRE
ncbi:MAG: OadG family protein [Firmicutes bacterium]|nr:OadG family protein [Bacillota bacterium]